MMMASRVCSSPIRVQLQASMPTGKDSKIMCLIVGGIGSDALKNG